MPLLEANLDELGTRHLRPLAVAHAPAFRQMASVAVAVEEVLAQPIALAAVDADDGDGSAVGGARPMMGRL
jgi:hypothetical protein